MYFYIQKVQDVRCLTGPHTNFCTAQMRGGGRRQCQVTTQHRWNCLVSVLHVPFMVALIPTKCCLDDVKDFESGHGLLFPLVPALQDLQQGDFREASFSLTLPRLLILLCCLVSQIWWFGFGDGLSVFQSLRAEKEKYHLKWEVRLRRGL